MGQYTELHLGKYYYSWKNQIPEYLVFIFEESDFYSVWDDSEDWYESIGYLTTCEKAIKKLESFGYSIKFISEIYEFFSEELEDLYIDYLKREIKDLTDDNNVKNEIIEKKAQEIFASWPKLSPYEEVKKFISCLRQIQHPEYRNPWSPSGKTFTLEDGRKLDIPSREYKIKHGISNVSIDFTELDRYIRDNILQTPPEIYKLVGLFNFDYAFKSEFSEIITLMFLRLVLDTIEDLDTEVKLELRDIIEDEEEAHNLLFGLGKYLVDKISLYNKVFHSLFLSEEDIRTSYIKSQCKELLSLNVNLTSPYAKGKILETLTEILFTSNNYLELADKRVSTGDEEIDLLIKNNINRPFWMAFNSPLLFVECKNWSTPVGSKEIRDFEIKLQNHRNVVKVGFFVSINGFTSEAINELRRIGRDEYHLITIDLNDVYEYINSNDHFFDWLEKKASKIY